ncbi:MAG: PRC-barrel domain-containing protein [Planctomycetota bacterium]
MFTRISHFALLGALVLPVVAQVPQEIVLQENARRGRRADSQGFAYTPRYVASDELLGSAVRTEGGRTDRVTDALLSVEDGSIQWILLESGATMSPANLRWYADESALEQQEGRVMEASFRREPEPEAEPPRSFLLSRLVQLPLYGVERDNGATEVERLGRVDGAQIDLEAGAVTHLLTSVGGVLGFGKKRKLIPFHAGQVLRDNNGEFGVVTSITKERLKESPLYGEGPDNLQNPAYRDAIYSYYGVERPLYDRRRGEADVAVVTVSHLLGNEIITPSEQHTVGDIIVDVRTGAVGAIVRADGKLVAPKSLSWSWLNDTFHTEAGVDTTELDATGEHMMVSHIDDAPILIEGRQVATVEDLYYDTVNATIRYVTVDNDGLRVLPWSVFSVRTAEDGQRAVLDANLTRESLETHPVLDARAGSSLYDPEFRRRIDAIAKRPATPAEKVEAGAASD